MNGFLWHIKYVDPDSNLLVDRTNNYRVATTDPRTQTIYLSTDISGDFLRRVLIHELGHCVMLSYNLLDDIHKVVPKAHWIQAEEWVCNFLADYGLKVFDIASRSLGDEAIMYVPYELERFIA